MTSRPKGEYETDGENFWFLTEEELVASLDRDEFMEVKNLDQMEFQNIKSISGATPHNL